ncbi:MAG: sensor histidine kinase [Chloroflexota bacterium]
MLKSDDELLAELDRRFKECRTALEEHKKLAAELIETNRKLVESEALKSHFISSITNEIINPFSSILGLSRSIIMIYDQDPGKVKNMARMIYNEAFSMDFQLRNIFTAAKIEAGEIFPETSEISVNETIADIIRTFRHEADRRNIRIKFHELPVGELFVTDREKFRLLMSNLISNAIKFNVDEGEVIVDAVFADGCLTMKVTDSGQGINSSLQEKVFDRFQRINDEINSRNTGHGLGLSIVKSLVELLGGTVSVNSTGNSTGSEFIVSLPESGKRANVYDIEADPDLPIDGNNELF